MTPDARTTARASSGTLLEAAALVMAGITALVVIARSDAEPRRDSIGAHGAVPATAKPLPPADADEAERQAALRDMLLHD